jgi:dynein heavy chain
LLKYSDLGTFLENLFIGSEEVKKELPRESEKFVDIDKEVKGILKDGEAKKIAIISATKTMCSKD